MMLRPASPRYPFLLIALLCTVIGADRAAAQPRANQASASPQSQDQPPIMRFPGAGISLEEAVRLTLQHDPTLRIAEADADFRGGVAQEQSGLFDVSLFGSFDFSRRVQELTESAKDEQRRKRTALDDQIRNSEEAIPVALMARDLIEKVQQGTVSPAELAETSPTLADTMIALDELIANSSGPQKAALEELRQETLADALTTADSMIATEQDNLAKATQDRRNLGEAPDDEVFTDITTSVQVSKLFRSGISITPFFDAAFNSTNYRGKPHQAEFGGKGLTDLYTFHAGVDAVLPLARGRGADAVAAPERAARIEHDGSLLVLEHQRPTSVLNTALAYWALRAAQESAQIATRSLEFQQDLVALISALVDSGDQAGVELSRAQAAEARARGDVEDAQRRLKDARVDLAITIGIGASIDDDSTLPLAGDDFPQPPPSAPPEPSPVLVDQALQQRQDLAAAMRFEEAGDVLAKGARLNLGPLLDLGLGTWYTALDEGSFGAAVDRWVGPSAAVSLLFEKPLGNNALEGQLTQQESSARLRQIDQADLARQIQLNVIRETSTLQESISRVQQARAAVDFYQATVDAESQRLRTGDATVLDLIVTQQQQIGALIDLVSARLELANRIVLLRFETGTLVTDGAVQAHDLVTVPNGTL